MTGVQYLNSLSELVTVIKDKVAVLETEVDLIQHQWESLLIMCGEQEEYAIALLVNVARSLHEFAKFMGDHAAQIDAMKR